MAIRWPRSLYRRIVLWLLAFASALTLAFVMHGAVVVEYVERAVWKSMLTNELEYFIQRRQQEPDYPWGDGAGFSIHIGLDDPGLPPETRDLPLGLHDDVPIGSSNHVVLVHDQAGTRYTLSMAIDQFTADDVGAERIAALASLLLLVVVSIAAAFGVRRLLRPLSHLARSISSIQPEHGAQRVEIQPDAGSELLVIADAFNDYLQRNALFIERERTFIMTASHELRTPVAVINGAVELALQPDVSQASVRIHVQRIQRTAREMEQLIVLLLTLAKDPTSLASTSKPIALDELLSALVEDHQHLATGKSLCLRLAPLSPCQVHAPEGVVRAAVGNLLRNAIENSDSGCIDIHVHDDAQVVIRDPGHGMSPAQISEIYSRTVRSGVSSGDSGIGLLLTSRLCEHFGWRLEFLSHPERGTTAQLDLSGGLRQTENTVSVGRSAGSTKRPGPLSRST